MGGLPPWLRARARTGSIGRCTPRFATVRAVDRHSPCGTRTRGGRHPTLSFGLPARISHTRALRCCQLRVLPTVDMHAHLDATVTCLPQQLAIFICHGVPHWHALHSAGVVTTTRGHHRDLLLCSVAGRAAGRARSHGETPLHFSSRYLADRRHGTRADALRTVVAVRAAHARTRTAACCAHTRCPPRYRHFRAPHHMRDRMTSRNRITRFLPYSCSSDNSLSHSALALAHTVLARPSLPSLQLFCLHTPPFALLPSKPTWTFFLHAGTAPVYPPTGCAETGGFGGTNSV